MSIKNHFEDCPYDCNAMGKLLDVNTGKMVDCPHCSKLKKELLAKGEVIEEDRGETPLAEVLGIKSKYLSQNYVFDGLIPDGEKLFLEGDSVDFLKTETERLYNKLTLGELPESSYCFGISIKGRVDRLAYPLLAKAYLSGYKIGRFITCSELSRLQLRGDDEIDRLLENDLQLVMIGEGSTKGEISCGKGLMQTRALRGKPTIFITTWTIEASSLLLGYADEEENLFLAKPVFVRYKNSGKRSNYINQLTGVENSRYSEGTPVGEFPTADGSVGYSISDL